MKRWRISEITHFDDDRGSLAFTQSTEEFEIKRIYYLFNCDPLVKRGAHAHKDLTQKIICVSGQCNITFDDGEKKQDFLLKSPTEVITVESMVWRDIYKMSEDCVLLVLANQLYSEDDYIRDYQEFLDSCNT